MFDFLSIASAIFFAYFFSLIFNLELFSDLPSEYELKRRAREGDSLAKKKAWIKKHSGEVDLSLKLVAIVFELLLIWILSSRLGKVWPALVLSFMAFGLMKFVKVKKFAPKMFVFWEKFFIANMQNVVALLKLPLPFLYVRARKANDEGGVKRSYYSEEEFAYRFSLDAEVLSDPTRNKIDRLLKGNKTKAKDIMVDIEKIPKVDVNLSLTPIIYDELHKKGFAMAAVFQGEADNFVGLLYLSGSEAVEQMNNVSVVRVGDRMEQSLQYVTQDVKLDDLVGGFLQGGHNAVLVTGANGRVIGVVTSKKLLAWVSGA